MRGCLLSLVCLAAAFGCSGSGRPVECVIPDGYRGQGWLFLDPDAPDVPVVDGRYQVVFPPDGLLRVRSMRPFEQRHAFSARYANGTPLSVLGHHAVPTHLGEAALWAGPRSATFPDKRDYIAWVVGTEADFKAVRLDQFAPPVSR